MGFRDSENYRRRENKDAFNQIFLRTNHLDDLIRPNNFFLLGEKGTGKTAYAVFLSNNDYSNTLASIRYIRETEYQKFVNLKKREQLSVSDFASIWKVTIFVLIAQQIREKEKNSIGNFLKFNKLSAAIDEYFHHAFSPEVVQAIQFAEEATKAAQLISRFASVGGQEKASVAYSESNFQINLIYLQKQFEEALGSLKLTKDHILFIDGIDVRPETIDYAIYNECIKGLANAIWSINNDFFANVKDSKGRVKVVLLARPDIFNSLGLQNLNSKVRDNSVILDWATTYSEYRTSPIFLLIDKLLSYQQEKDYPPGAVWNYYFPFNAVKLRSNVASPSSFITFLRYSLYRPRDLITILSIQKENRRTAHSKSIDVFSYDDFTLPAFTRKYSDYLLGEIRDHIVFYYDIKDYELFLKFFQYLNGKGRFSYPDYLSAFKSYLDFLKRNEKRIPDFCETPDIFLQFLYDLNVLCYVVKSHNESFFGWCYRERSPSNIAPKVRTEAHYLVHYGLMKALDLGRTFKSPDW